MHLLKNSLKKSVGHLTYSLNQDFKNIRIRQNLWAAKSRISSFITNCNTFFSAMC